MEESLATHRRMKRELSKRVRKHAVLQAIKVIKPSLRATPAITDHHRAMIAHNDQAIMYQLASGSCA